MTDSTLTPKISIPQTPSYVKAYSPLLPKKAVFFRQKGKTRSSFERTFAGRLAFRWVRGLIRLLLLFCPAANQ
ncbi:MAG: hypothetical protein IJY89_03220, partial [Clostridia bacterium]|nr:hypothetical protein [Clostridia bacterium]